MGIISYAQNFEDVILWRVLGHVKNGTYVDVGAHHPDIDSVSKAFYDRGWRGVHAEPGPDVAQLLRQKRPGDIVVQALISNAGGIHPFYETPGGGLSTGDKDVADFHVSHGNAPVSVTTAISLPLDEVLEVVPTADIHWLKIDVEGFEKQVLLSWRTSRRRPWVLVIEATYPKTQEPTHDQWEDIVLSKGYSLVYEDGLNRFYLSDQHQELKDKFRYPPNVFDEFQVNPSGSSVFSKDMKDFMEGEVFSRADRIKELEQALAQTQSTLAQVIEKRDVQRTIDEMVGAYTREAKVREDALVERLFGQNSLLSERIGALQSRVDYVEHSIDEHALNLKAQGQFANTFEQLSTAHIDALWRQSIRNHRLPWPMRIFTHTKRISVHPRWSQRSGHNTLPAISQLIALPDEQFLRTAYLLIMDREIDENGLLHYLGKLNRQSKASVLADIALSKEAMQKAVGGDLADLSDKAFIEAVYLRMLGRPADTDGREHSLQRLAAGTPREDIVTDLKHSLEGQRYQGEFRQGLRQLVRAENSLLGWRKWFSPIADAPVITLSVGQNPIAIETRQIPYQHSEQDIPEQVTVTSFQEFRQLRDELSMLYSIVSGIAERQRLDCENDLMSST